MRQVRNFVTRLSIHYLLISVLLLLRGISRDQQLFGVWIVAFVFTALTVSVRRLLLILALPLIIMTGGLFIFVVDGAMLALTAALTRLNINNFWWALLGVLVMSSTNIWIERAFSALGWWRDAEPGYENVMTRRSPSWWLRLTLLIVLLFGIVYSAAMAAQIFLAVSILTTNTTIIAIAACVGFALLIWGIAWLVAEGLALDRRARFSVVSAAVATLLVAIPASVLILEADPVTPAPAPTPRPDTQYWDLTTGSRIAYSVFPAEDPRAGRNPIVFLHDLGRAVLDTDIEFFRQFSEEGFTVYLYDQVGCGLSERLNDIADYTIARHVEDLEAIRETIEADRLVLVGHAGGSEIAGRYMIEHRDRVQSVIFYSPTPLWDDEQYATDETRTAALSSGEPASLFALPALGIRPSVAAAVAVHNPQTAQAYVSQEEMVAWADQTVNEGTMVCAGNPELAPQPESPGYNPYVGIVSEVTANQSYDPRPLLRELLIPTILLRGECDPVDPAVVSQYQEAISFLQVYYLEEAGSMLHLSRPDDVKRTILTLLRKERSG